jgi:prepilin-type N-terminal cleavage/methylation domain-containing protein
MKRFQRGFTLIELLAVIAIIGILAALILVSLSNARKQAADVQRKSVVRAIAQAEESYANNHTGTYSLLSTDIVPLMSSAPANNCMLTSGGTGAQPWFGSSQCLQSDGNGGYKITTFEQSTTNEFQCTTGGSCYDCGGSTGKACL